jgi:hypothetical protein
MRSSEGSRGQQANMQTKIPENFPRPGQRILDFQAGHAFFIHCRDESTDPNSVTGLYNLAMQEAASNYLVRQLEEQFSGDSDVLREDCLRVVCKGKGDAAAKLARFSRRYTNAMRTQLEFKIPNRWECSGPLPVLSCEIEKMSQYSRWEGYLGNFAASLSQEADFDLRMHPSAELYAASLAGGWRCPYGMGDDRIINVVSRYELVWWERVKFYEHRFDSTGKKMPLVVITALGLKRRHEAADPDEPFVLPDGGGWMPRSGD